MDKRNETFLEYLLRKEKEAEKRPKVMPEPLPMYEHDCSKYPDQIRVSFADGHTAVYDMRVDQPAPVILENIRIIRK